MFSNSSGNHSDNIILQIDSLLKAAGISLAALEALTVNLGPGSFTGLRIGMSVVTALAQAAKIPIVGFNAFEAIAFDLKTAEGDFLAVIACRGDEYYAAQYKASSGQVELIGKYSIININAYRTPSQTLRLIGAGAEKFYYNLPDRSSGKLVLDNEWAEFPTLKSFAELTKENFEEKASPGHNPPDLFYLALSQAEVNYDRKKYNN